MTPSVRLFIAEESEQTGQFSAALVMADACARDAQIGYVTVRVGTTSPAGLRVHVG